MKHRITKATFILACAATLSLSILAGAPAQASENEERVQPYSVDPELVQQGYFEDGVAAACIPDGSADDTLGQTSCCSGYAVSGSTVCSNPADYGTTSASCRHVCGTAPVNGCIPSGGIDDTLSITYCCSGQAVSGSTWCLDPADYGTDWKSCVQRCA